MSKVTMPAETVPHQPRKTKRCAHCCFCTARCWIWKSAELTPCGHVGQNDCRSCIAPKKCGPLFNAHHHRAMGPRPCWQSGDSDQCPRPKIPSNGRFV